MPWWGWALIGIGGTAYATVGAVYTLFLLGEHASVPRAIRAGAAWPIYIWP